MKRLYVFALVLGSLSVTTNRTFGTPKNPDNSGSNPNNPSWRLRETGPANAPITVWPTNDGKRIKNANGEEVRFTDVLSGPKNEATFLLTGLINGLPVTDAEQRTGKPGDPADPGTLFLSVFTDGVMTTNSLGKWLFDNGYSDSNEIFMPDFFPATGQEISDVYYGVNLAELGNVGKNFVDSHSFGETFTINGGTIPELPMYIFSATPLSYVPGTGWSGAPLADGTQVEFVAFHAAKGIPEPSTLALFGVGIVGLLRYRWRKWK